MQITEKWLMDKGACLEGRTWFVEQGITELIAGIKNLINHDKLQWANWLIVRAMTRKQYLAYAIFAAEQVIDIYERRNPNNKAPRQAIEAAKKVLARDTVKNRKAAAAAAAADAYAAYDADAAAYAAAYAVAAAAAADAYDADADADAYADADADDDAAAAYAAADAAADAAAAYAAYNAAYAAYADADADDAAAAAAAYAAADAARKEMRVRILNFGLSLLQRPPALCKGAK